MTTRTTFSKLNKPFILAGLAGLLAAGTVQAQSAALSVTAPITFGRTLTTDSLTAASTSLLWTGADPLNLDSAVTFPVTGTGTALTGQLSGMPFMVSTLPGQLMPNVAGGPTLKFKPRHNIQHNTEVVICSGQLPGCISIDLKGSGRYADTYYAATEDLSEQALRTSLKTIINTGFTGLGYNGGRDKMYELVDNWRTNGQGATVNTTECVYTGRVVTGYTGRSDIFSNDSINTEHTMPQSLFGQSEPMRGDVHHLFPADEHANGVRSNFPFDTVPAPTISLPGGSKFNGSKFEPRDLQKGRTARALLYFAVKYQDYQGFIAGQEAVIRRWSRHFVPTAQEVKRNDLIQQFQHNRNPFSDHQELLERISSVTAAASTAPELNTFRYFPQSAENLTVRQGDTLRIYVSVVNTGNQDLTLTTPIFPSANWTLEGPVAPPVIPPGEALNARLRFIPSQGGREAGNFSFVGLQGTVAGTTVTIPISIDVITAVASKASAKVRVWPTVFSTSIRFSAQQPSSVSLYDLQGRPLWAARGLTEGAIPTEQLSAGSYLVRVAGPQGVRTFTVVK